MFTQDNGGFRVGCYDIGHLRRAGVARSNHKELFLHFFCSRNGSNTYNNAFLPPNCSVELVDQFIHYALHLAAIVMPHGDSHRFFWIQPFTVTPDDKEKYRYTEGRKKNPSFQWNRLRLSP